MAPSYHFTVPDQPTAPLPAPQPAAKPVDPNALTREERMGMNFALTALLYTLGAAAVGAILFGILLGLHYAWTFGEGFRGVAVIAAAWIIAILVLAGALLVTALTWDTRPIGARISLGLWIACMIAIAVLVGRTAMHKAPTEPAAPHAVQVDRDLTDDEREAAAEASDLADELRYADRMIEARGARQGDLDRRADVAERLASARSRIHRPAQAAPAVAQAQAPASFGFDAAILTFITLLGCGVLPALTVAAHDAIMSAKPRRVAEAMAASAPRPSEAAAAPPPYLPAEAGNGFDFWAASCISKPKVSGLPPLRSGEAYAHYLNFCARNDFDAPLANTDFGRRLRAHMMNAFSIEGRHSGAAGGTVYDGAVLATLSNSMNVNGAVNGAIA